MWRGGKSDQAAAFNFLVFLSFPVDDNEPQLFGIICPAACLSLIDFYFPPPLHRFSLSYRLSSAFSPARLRDEPFYVAVLAPHTEMATIIVRARGGLSDADATGANC